MAGWTTALGIAALLLFASTLTLLGCFAWQLYEARRRRRGEAVYNRRRRSMSGMVAVGAESQESQSPTGEPPSQTRSYTYTPPGRRAPEGWDVDDPPAVLPPTPQQWVHGRTGEAFGSPRRDPVGSDARSRRRRRSRSVSTSPAGARGSSSSSDRPPRQRRRPRRSRSQDDGRVRSHSRGREPGGFEDTHPLSPLVDPPRRVESDGTATTSEDDGARRRRNGHPRGGHAAAGYRSRSGEWGGAVGPRGPSHGSSGYYAARGSSSRDADIRGAAERRRQRSRGSSMLQKSGDGAAAWSARRERGDSGTPAFARPRRRESLGSHRGSMTQWPMQHGGGKGAGYNTDPLDDEIRFRTTQLRCASFTWRDRQLIPPATEPGAGRRGSVPAFQNGGTRRGSVCQPCMLRPLAKTTTV